VHNPLKIKSKRPALRAFCFFADAIIYSMPKRSPKKTSFLENFLIPHRGNRFRPLFFTAGSVVAIAAFVFVLQSAYLVDTHVLEKHTHFMASVLPGVLEELTNADRTTNGVGDLAVDPLLNSAAQLKADDMAANGYFAHISPAGKTPWYWLGQVGYQYTYAGENLAVDFTDSKDVESAWMASPTHHANIVKPEYTRIGFGVSQGMYEGHQTTFVVEEFAAPRLAVATPQTVSSDKTIAATKSGVDTTAPAAPTQTAAQVVAAATAGAPGSSTPPVVLGAETNDLSSPVTTAPAGLFANILASPTHSISFALGALAAILAVILLVTLIAHARVQYVEVVGTGLVMVSLILVVLMFNQVSGSRVVIPSGTQSAAVVNALP
jgi:hypothetical protein